MERRQIIIASVIGVVLAIGVTGVVLVLRQRAAGTEGTVSPIVTNGSGNVPVDGGANTAVNEAVNGSQGGGQPKVPTPAETAARVEVFGNGTVQPYQPAASDQDDPDGDSLTNAEEKKAGTDPNDPDTDNDGLLDGYEVKNFNTDPLKADTNGNGINDSEESAQTRQ